MDNVVVTIKNVWPNACWSISQYDKKNYTGYVSNGNVVGTKFFASGYATGKTWDEALVKAFKAAMRKEYEVLSVRR